MSNEQLRKRIITRIEKGHPYTLKKAVSAKKSPTGEAIPAVVKQIVGCTTKDLLTKEFLASAHVHEAIVEDELLAMRREGIILCTNGMWLHRELHRVATG